MKYLKFFNPLPLGVVLLIAFTSGGVSIAKPAFGYGGSSGGRVLLSQPAAVASALPEAAKKVDVNNDGKISLIDFNSLMVNWGKTGGDASADFNDDEAVDLLDFNLLMVHWQE